MVFSSSGQAFNDEAQAKQAGYNGALYNSKQDAIAAYGQAGNSAAPQAINAPTAPAAPPAPFSTMPQYPGYDSILDGDNNLLSKYKLNNLGDVNYTGVTPELNQKLLGINVNQDPLHNLEAYAGSTGDSPWAQVMLQKNKAAANQQYGDVGAQAEAGATQARGDLAAHGGLSQGAMERIANGSARNAVTGKQGVTNNANMADLSVRGQDEAQRMSVATQLPGLEVQSAQPELAKANLWAGMASTDAGRQYQADQNNRLYTNGVDQFNIGNNVNGVNSTNQFNLGKYQSDMGGYAANQTANAIEHSGKK